MVFQKPNPFPMSVYDNIAYGPRTHGIHSKLALDEIVETSLRQAAIWDEVKDRLKKSALLPCPTKKDVPERSVRHVLRVLSCSAFNLSRSGYHRAVLGRVKVMWKPLSPKNSAVISGLRIWGSPMSLSICQGVRSLPRVADRSFMSSSGKVPQVART